MLNRADLELRLSMKITSFYREGGGDFKNATELNLLLIKMASQIASVHSTLETAERVARIIVPLCTIKNENLRENLINKILSLCDTDNFEQLDQIVLRIQEAVEQEQIKPDHLDYIMRINPDGFYDFCKDIPNNLSLIIRNNLARLNSNLCHKYQMIQPNNPLPVAAINDIS